jgi:HK97 family phage prohead protease
MPWRVVPNHPDCPASEPFGVVNSQTGRKVACHMTEADAIRHVRALYANVPESQQGASMAPKPDFRAEWDTAYINNLPDSAFAYIEPGGSKDADGKTTPRSLRHFPIKNAQGQCDRAHTRNALSRAPQSPFGAKALPKIRACARALGIEVSESSSQGASMSTELRYTPVPVELRSGDGQPAKIVGYAAVFDSASQNLGGFKEQVGRNAFNRSASRGWERVVARYNHDDNFILGSSDARTLRLHADDQGLHYEIDPPTSRSDVVESIGRGDVRFSSFAFYTVEDDWGVDDTNFPRRTLESVDLVDVSPVVRPAYTGTNTDLALASLARRMDADFEEVRSRAEAQKLHTFFVRTDGPAAPKAKVFGPQARMDILKRKQDPNVA